MRKFVVFYKGCKLLKAMSTPPEGYVVLLTSISHKNISKELCKRPRLKRRGFYIEGSMI